MKSELKISQSRSSNAALELMPEHIPVDKLDPDMVKAFEKMEKMREIRESLPGIDCGACGAPTCRAHAEDQVRAGKKTFDCPILKARM